MATKFHSFKRLVLGLQPSAPDRAMRLAVELADLLQLDLLGLFVDDTSLRDLAGMPFAREFRPLGGGWHAIELERLSQELELAARKSEKIFSEAAKRLSSRCRFEVIRGPTAAVIEAVSCTSDIVMIVEPISPAERATQQFSLLAEAALQSASAVILVPPRIVRSLGPIVVIAAAQDDPSILAAAAIATAAKEELIVVDADSGAIDEAYLRKISSDTGLMIRHVANDLPFSDPALASHALRHYQERLVVVTRGVLTNDRARLLASLRGVPVLVVGPSLASSEETSGAKAGIS